VCACPLMPSASCLVALTCWPLQGVTLRNLGQWGRCWLDFHHDLNFIMVMLGCALVVGGWVCRFCRGGGGGGGKWGGVD
jgi:hypothetical protein